MSLSNLRGNMNVVHYDRDQAFNEMYMRRQIEEPDSIYWRDQSHKASRECSELCYDQVWEAFDAWAKPSYHRLTWRQMAERWQHMTLAIKAAMAAGADELPLAGMQRAWFAGS